MEDDHSMIVKRLDETRRLEAIMDWQADGLPAAVPEPAPPSDLDVADFDLLRERVGNMRARLEQKALSKKLQQVWVLIFNPGSEREGIHSLAVDDANVILGFEDRGEARRFAATLKAQEFFDPVATQIAPREVRDFVRGRAGLSFVVVPRGSGLVPPERSREMVDHDDAFYSVAENRRGGRRVVGDDADADNAAEQIALSPGKLEQVRSLLEHQLQDSAERSPSAVGSDFWTGEAFG